MTRRRILMTLCAAAVAAVAPATADAGASPAAPAARVPELAADLEQCLTGVAPEQRTAVFTASMPAGREAGRLALRVTLQERRAGAKHFRTLRVPNFGTWQRAEPGVRGYVVSKRVEQLAAGSAYRVAVQFRWYDASGASVRSARRTSPVCRQPDLRADLRVTGVTLEPAADPSSAVYRVSVRNDGRGAVRDPFLVTLALGPTLLTPRRPVADLAPGAAAVVAFDGPPCEPGSPLRAVADAGGAVDEADEDDNVLSRACPGP